MSLMDYLFGRRLATDEEGEQRVGVVAGIPMLGLDALGSAAYGPEARLTLLIPLGRPASALHRADQHADHHPPAGRLFLLPPDDRGLSRRAAGRTPSPRRTWAPRPACSPPRRCCWTMCWSWPSASRRVSGRWSRPLPVLQPYTLPLCLAILALITLVNLRGVRESGLAFVVPTYLFVVSLLAVLAIGVVKAILAGGQPVPVVPPPHRPSAATGGEPMGPDASLRQRLHGDDRRRGGQQRRHRLPRAGGRPRPADADGDHRAAGRHAGRHRLPVPGLRHRRDRAGPGGL